MKSASCDGVFIPTHQMQWQHSKHVISAQWKQTAVLLDIVITRFNLIRCCEITIGQTWHDRHTENLTGTWQGSSTNWQRHIFPIRPCSCCVLPHFLKMQWELHVLCQYQTLQIWLCVPVTPQVLQCYQHLLLEAGVIREHSSLHTITRNVANSDTALVPV